MKAKQGFTLLEVVVGITILGILLSISIPQFASYYRWLKLRGTVNRLITTFHLARQRSVVGDKKWGIIFLSAQNKYLLVKGKQNPQVKTETQLPAKIEYKEITFPVYKGRKALFFKHLGNLDTGNGQVVLKSESEVQKIVISSNAGEINVR